MPETIIKFDPIIDDVIEEYNRAVHIYGAFTTLHEAYAVILEEMDELWAEIKKKSNTRTWKRTKKNKKAIRKEAIHVAAMAIRLIMDLED